MWKFVKPKMDSDAPKPAKRNAVTGIFSDCLGTCTFCKKCISISTTLKDY